VLQKLGVRASAELKVGDTVELKATLTSPKGDLVKTVLVRISDPEREPDRKAPQEEPPPGIPDLVLCSKAGGEGMKPWDDMGEPGTQMDHGTVVFPFVDEDKLSRIYVNVDSTVLKDFKSGAKSTEAIGLAERRYISAVYFHTLFLFATTKARHYDLQRQEGERREDVELADCVSDLFSSSYAQFLLSFDTSDMIDAVS